MKQQRTRATLETTTNADLARMHDLVEDLIPDFLESIGIDPFEDPKSQLLWDFEVYLASKVNWPKA